ncbi:MAG TPA: lactate utilization protein [Tissierellaceae bacterium]|nr:lactate utilization protein [Tissierellaceae bacterium]
MEKYQELVKKLEINGFTCNVFEDSYQVKKYLLEEIKLEDSIAIGGSMTIKSLNLFEDFKERGNQVFWHWKADKVDEELKRAKTAKIYLTSTNALTLDGKLVNMDGNGNRVASMVFGHEKVFIIVGKNKICKDYESAIERIETVAAPKNAKRLGLNTYCSQTGECNDCYTADRMCSVETIIHKNPGKTKINICLVDEELGY